MDIDGHLQAGSCIIITTTDTQDSIDIGLLIGLGVKIQGRASLALLTAEYGCLSWKLFVLPWALTHLSDLFP